MADFGLAISAPQIQFSKNISGALAPHFCHVSDG
jgi:hypothetical protein